MGKAITGAAELAGAIGLGAIAFALGSTGVGFAALPFLLHGMEALALAGAATEAGALADAITSNRGQNITTRQPASFRQIIYGTQRVGGVEIWRSTTGSSHDQFNFVIVLATHELWAITDLYLDGRKVYWQSGSSGQSTRNGYTFGGSSDGNTYTGPDGQPYNFGDRGHGPMVYCEARFGDQATTDYITGLTANDSAWAPSGGKTPSVAGCAYVYLKIEYDQTLFPQEPEIRFTVMGKPVYDPRSATTAYSANPALIISDILGDEDFGVGGETCNADQLVAAANICDEMVTCAVGSEYRYTTHWHYDTSTEPGDAIAMFLAGCGGRMSKSGGEWYIFPAAYSAPVMSLTADQLRGPVVWSEKRAGRDIFNRVTGTYTAPNYPYSVVGNLYDSNGWADGSIENNFPYAFQPSNYPMYACDPLHGYASDQYLTEDGGTRLPKEIGFPQVLSISQAQRLAKIALLRNRQQGTGSLDVSLAAFQLTACDTFNLTFAATGWTDKLLEVNAFQFFVDTSSGTPQIRLSLGVNETDSSIYDWSEEEELSAYDVPVMMASATSTPTAPTDLVLTSSAATAVQQPDGSVVPRIEVTWNEPQDVFVNQIQVQYQRTGDSAWSSSSSVDATLTSTFIGPVVAGQNYNVRIRSVRTTGVVSSWVEIDGFTAGLVLNTQSQDGIGLDSLVGEGYPSGAAAIECNPFAALIGTLSLSIFPGGPVTITTDGTIGGSAGNLAQQTLYYVYYVDPNAAGGNVTPIATTNRADFLGKAGYFLIDSVVTPYAASGGGGTSTAARYYPNTAVDGGTRSSITPAAAYDQNLSTSATISALDTGATSTFGSLTISGFPSVTLTASSTLTVVASALIAGSQTPPGEVTLTAVINGTSSSLLDVTATTAKNSYSVAVPSGVDLSTIVVTATATATAVPTDLPTGTPEPAPDRASLSVFEVYVQP
jgi:hypothetical protein